MAKILGFPVKEDERVPPGVVVVATGSNGYAIDCNPARPMQAFLGCGCVIFADLTIQKCAEHSKA